MDINDLRGISTLIVLAVFIGICLWAYSSKKKADFDDAADLPFQDDDISDRTMNVKETD